MYCIVFVCYYLLHRPALNDLDLIRPISSYAIKYYTVHTTYTIYMAIYIYIIIYKDQYDHSN